MNCTSSGFPTFTFAHEVLYWIFLPNITCIEIVNYLTLKIYLRNVEETLLKVRLSRLSITSCFWHNSCDNIIKHCAKHIRWKRVHEKSHFKNLFNISPFCNFDMGIERMRQQKVYGKSLSISQYIIVLFVTQSWKGQMCSFTKFQGPYSKEADKDIEAL